MDKVLQQHGFSDSFRINRPSGRFKHIWQSRGVKIVIFELGMLSTVCLFDFPHRKSRMRWACLRADRAAAGEVPGAGQSRRVRDFGRAALSLPARHRAAGDEGEGLRRRERHHGSSQERHRRRWEAQESKCVGHPVQRGGGDNSIQPPKTKSGKTIAEEDEVWAKAKENDFNFKARGGAGNPLASRFDRMLKAYGFGNCFWWLDPFPESSELHSTGETPSEKREGGREGGRER